MSKKPVNFQEIESSVKEFINKKKKFLAKVDFVVGVSRGGLVPAALLAAKIGKPLVAAYINKQDEIFLDRAEWIKDKNALVVDDVIRSGKTLWLMKNFLENEAKPAAISFFVLGEVIPLKNDAYNIPSLAQRIDHDLIFPWDD